MGTQHRNQSKEMLFFHKQPNTGVKHFVWLLWRLTRNFWGLHALPSCSQHIPAFLLLWNSWMPWRLSPCVALGIWAEHTHTECECRTAGKVWVHFSGKLLLWLPALLALWASFSSSGSCPKLPFVFSLLLLHFGFYSNFLVWCLLQ